MSDIIISVAGKEGRNNGGKYDSMTIHECKGVSDNSTVHSQTASWFAKDFHSEKQLLLDSTFSAQHPQPARTKGPSDG